MSAVWPRDSPAGARVRPPPRARPRRPTHHVTAARAVQVTRPMPQPDKKRFVKRMAKSFTACAAETRKYGDCIRLHYEAVDRNNCEKEFLALHKCFKTALKQNK